MRILVANWSSREVGGAETYLGDLLPCLGARGHELGLLSELDAPIDRTPIALPERAPRWAVDSIGRAGALRNAGDWAPDLVYVHQLEDPSLERDLLELAPAVLFAHGYHGTCVSGSKTFKSLSVRPCSRRFGLMCLAHYYPHHCGGWSPVSMMREYRRQRGRNRLLSHYAAIVTASEHMRREFMKHGLRDGDVHKLTHYVRAAGAERDLWGEGSSVQGVADSESGGLSFQLLFVGRMDFLKGGRVLLSALPQVATTLRRPVHLTMIGDGPDREQWERQAQHFQAADPPIVVDFLGWLGFEAIDRLLLTTHLLVVPSLWPEPFGQVGPESALRGVPAVAFDVGGISEWLLNGVNGYLASASPPRAEDLAHAIVKALGDPVGYERLRSGARETVQRFNLDRHVKELEDVFTSVVGTRV